MTVELEPALFGASGVMLISEAQEWTEGWIHESRWDGEKGTGLTGGVSWYESSEHLRKSVQSLKTAEFLSDYLYLNCMLNCSA